MSFAVGLDDLNAENSLGLCTYVTFQLITLVNKLDIRLVYIVASLCAIFSV